MSELNSEPNQPERTPETNPFNQLANAFFPDNSGSRLANKLERLVEQEKWDKVAKQLDQLSNNEENPALNLLEEKGTPFIALLAIHDAPAHLATTALKKGADPSEELQSENKQLKEFQGLTPLHIAAKRGNAELTEALVRYDPSLSSLENVGNERPIDLALETAQNDKNWTTVRSLLTANPDVSLTKSSDWRGADLHELELHPGFAGKDLRESNLIDTDLSAVRLRSAEGELLTPVEGAWYGSQTMLPRGTLPQYEGMRRAHQIWDGANKAEVTDSQLEQKYLQAVDSFTYSSKCLAEARGFNEKTDSLTAGLLYTETYKALLNPAQKLNVPLMDEFIVQTLSGDIEPEDYRELLLKVDMMMDGEEYGEEYPYLPELMLLARDPGLDFSDVAPEGDTSHLSRDELLEIKDRELEQKYQLEPYTLAVSSIMGWRESFAVPNTQSLYDWGRVGQISREFLRYKFDTRAEVDGKKVIEHFGFERIPERNTDFHDPEQKSRGHLFGPGFDLDVKKYPVNFIKDNQFVSLNQDSYIEYRRAYQMISDPEHGTLVVRNSSNHFGRDALPFVAGWSPKGIGNGFTKDELQNLTPEEFEREFTSIIDPEMNVPTFKLKDGQGHFEFPTGTKVSALLDGLEGVREAYQGWRFDTNRISAWNSFSDPEGGKLHRLRGAFRSEGFKHFVGALEEEFKARDGEMSLALLPKHHAPLFTVPFKNELGFERNVLLLTEERIATLKDITANGWNQERVENAGLMDFFNTALQNQTDLAVLYESDK